MVNLEQRIVYHVDGMERVVTRRDLVYHRDGAAELRLDLYLPPDLAAAARRPAVFFIHGGPIPAEMPPPTSWGVYRSYGELVAASGLVGVAFNHRLHGPTQYGQSEADIAAAVAYVRAHAGEHHVDPERLALWAFSGGGTQLAWALRERPASVRALVAFYGLLDLRHALPPDAPPEQAEGARRFSPAAWIAERPELPLYVARAGRDAALINASIDRFAEAALAANAPLTLVTHPTGQHAFDILDDDARSREIIAGAVAFLRAHLG